MDVDLTFQTGYDDLEYFGETFCSFSDADLDLPNVPAEDISAEQTTMGPPLLSYPLLNNERFAEEVVRYLKLDTGGYTPTFELQSKSHGWAQRLLMQVGDSLAVEWNGKRIGKPFLYGRHGVIVPYTKSAAKKGTEFVFEMSPTHTYTSLLKSPFNKKSYGKFAVYFATRCRCGFCDYLN